jgi:hypothetical protein
LEVTTSDVIVRPVWTKPNKYGLGHRSGSGPPSTPQHQLGLCAETARNSNGWFQRGPDRGKIADVTIDVTVVEHQYNWDYRETHETALKVYGDEIWDEMAAQTAAEGEKRKESEMTRQKSKKLRGMR